MKLKNNFLFIKCGKSLKLKIIKHYHFMEKFPHSYYLRDESRLLE